MKKIAVILFLLPCVVWSDPREYHRQSVQKQIAQSFNVSQAIQELSGSLWIGHGEGFHAMLKSLDPFFDGYISKSQKNKMTKIFKIYFMDQHKGHIHIRFFEKNDEDFHSEFYVPFTYIQDEKILGRLHLISENKQNLFSIQVVSSQIMMHPIPYVWEKNNDEIIQSNVLFLRENFPKNCIQYNTILHQKLVPYNQLEDYLLQTQHGIKSKKKFHHFIITKEPPDQNSHNDYVITNVTKFSGFDLSSRSQLSQNSYILKCWDQETYLILMKDKNSTYFQFFNHNVAMFVQKIESKFFLHLYIIV